MNNEWKLRAKVLSIEVKQTEKQTYGKVHLEWNAYKDVMVQGTFAATGRMVYVMKEKLNQEIELSGKFMSGQGKDGGWFLKVEIENCWPVTKPPVEAKSETDQPPLPAGEEVPF